MTKQNLTEQKVILVTGSSNGFGRLTVESLARQGHTVFASMRNPSSRNAAVRTELLQLAKVENLDLHVAELDVTDDSSVEKAVAQVINLDRSSNLAIPQFDFGGQENGQSGTLAGT